MAHTNFVHKYIQESTTESCLSNNLIERGNSTWWLTKRVNTSNYMFIPNYQDTNNSCRKVQFYTLFFIPPFFSAYLIVISNERTSGWSVNVTESPTPRSLSLTNAFHPLLKRILLFVSITPIGHEFLPLLNITVIPDFQSLAADSRDLPKYCHSKILRIY